MSILKTKRTDKQNSGFSLVELVVAVGILAVIGTIVAFMMTSSSKNYRHMSLEAQLQSEAQLVANAISEYAIDAYDAKSICAGTIDSKYNNTNNKILVLKSKVKYGTDVKDTEYVVALDTTEKKLYLGTRIFDDTLGSWGAYDFALLGNNIADFTVDLSNISNNIINFKLNYTKDEKKYDGNYQILMRNRAYADASSLSENNNPDFKMVIGVQPKQVYVDVKGGSVTGYYANDIVDGASISTPVPLTASVTATTNVGDDVKWEISDNVKGSPFINFAPGDGAMASTGSIDFADDQDFEDFPIDDFSVTISKQKAFPNGKVVSASPKTVKVHMRRVKSINLIATSGSTSWKKSYEALGGVESKEANTKGYCYADAYGNYQTMNLNANIIQKWVPYGGGLLWKLEMKPIDGEWTDNVPARYARLQTDKTTSSTMNSVIFGKSVMNGQLFKVTVTSIFDPTKEATYIFGVAPWKLTTGGGYNSRGYYTNLNEFFLNSKFYDNGGNIAHFNGAENNGQELMRDAIKNGRPLIMELGSAGNTLENSALHLIERDGVWYLYIDYTAQKYQNANELNNMLTFYQGIQTTIEIRIWERKEDGSKGRQFANPFYYYLLPVDVHAANNQGIMVINPGDTASTITATDYYNLIGQDYLGIYVDTDGKGFSSNLNNANINSNPYLSFNMVNTYGDPEHYVDEAHIDITAKAPSEIRNPNLMTVRITADRYYNLMIKANQDLERKSVGTPSQYGRMGDFYTSSKVDYKVYMANVIGENTFIVTPQTTAGGDLSFPTNNVKAATKSNPYQIKGYNASGTQVTADAYYERGVYKCVYKGVVYTYNQTYHYWSK